ncbi:MAG: hypothetical protein BWY93_02017 [Euryarchaeota archaeon ADurb.BinA087]|nr:MAG: hypothetical protein BWY93_02017 [Euryarchaeota archaeon ADurb.BinA087]
MEGCSFDLPAHFPGTVTIDTVFRFEEDRHRGCTWFLSCVHNLDKAGKTQCDVNLGDSGIVKSPHRHLRSGFTDRLRSNNPYRFTGFNPGILVFIDDTVQDLVKLGGADFFRFEIFSQLLLGLHGEICIVNLSFLIGEHLTPLL